MQPINPPQIRENPSTTWFSVTSSRNDGRANVARIFVHRGKKECLLTIKPFVCSKQDRKQTLQFLLSASIKLFNFVQLFKIQLCPFLQFVQSIFQCCQMFNFAKLGNSKLNWDQRWKRNCWKIQILTKSRILELRFVTLLARYKSSKIMTRGKRYDELQMKRRSFSRLIYFPGQKQKTNKSINTAGHPRPFLYEFFSTANIVYPTYLWFLSYHGLKNIKMTLVM